MHKHVNHWIGEGQIKKNPTLRTTSNDYKVTNFLLRITTSYKVEDLENNNSKHKQNTVYVPIVAWSNLAELVVQKYNENDTVRVVGRLKNSSKTLNKPNWEIVLEDISMIQSAT